MSGHLSSITQRLAERLVQPVSNADRERARLHLLDWAGCVVAGAREPDCSRVRALAALEGAGPCTVVGGRPCGPHSAALANGPAGAILEMDDVDRRGLLHPGPVVIPAVLATAESLGIADGSTLLDAIVRGYEAMIRVGRAAGASHYRYFHPTATCGGFGAAVGAGSVMGLKPQRMAWALGLAGQQAFGLWRARHEPGSVKALHDGRAAANGLASAFLARDGFRGPLRVLEGDQGFFAGLAPEGDPQMVLAPANGWAVHDVSFKPHAACRHAHPAIDAALALRAAGCNPGRASVAIETYQDAVVFCDRVHPATVAEAKFSIQHAVAVALLFGDAGLGRFEPAMIDDPKVAGLRARISVFAASDLTAAYPARFGARATLTQGEAVIMVEALDAFGDPENPMHDAAVVAKARALMAWGGMEDTAAKHLIAVIGDLDRTTSVRDLSAALRGARP